MLPQRLTLAAAALLIAGAGFASLIGPAPAHAGGMMKSKTGDLNNDMVTNSVDALLVLFYDAGMSEPPMKGMDQWFAAADVNCDVTVNSIDASVILQAEAGLYDLRP